MNSVHFQDAPAWPGEAPPPMGHNRPPLDEEARDGFNEILDQKEGFRDRIVALCGSADRATCTNDDTLGRCGELVKQLRATISVIEDAHETTKAPFLAAGRAVDACKNVELAPLQAAKKAVEAKQNQYLRDQQAIQQAEDRRREEYLGPSLTVEIVHERQEPKIVRGDYGAAISAQMIPKSKVEDYDLAFIAVSSHIKVREAIDKAIAALVRGGQREIAGVNIYEDVKVSVR